MTNPPTSYTTSWDTTQSSPNGNRRPTPEVYLKNRSEDILKPDSEDVARK